MTAAGTGYGQARRQADSRTHRVTAKWLMGRFGVVLPWFVSITFLVQVGLYFLIDGLGASFSVSIFEGIAENVHYWYVFGMGVSLAYTYFPLHVAHGGTRRSFVKATTVAVIVGALVVALSVPIGYLVESLMYGRFDWSQEVRTGHLFGNSRQVGPILLEYGLHYSLVGLVGTMVASVYYRLGNLWGTALIPVTVLLPMVFESQLLHSGEPSGNSISLSDAANQSVNWLNTEILPLPLRLVLVACLLVVIVVVNHLVLREVPLHSKQG